MRARLACLLLAGCYFAASSLGASGNILLRPLQASTDPLAGINFLARFQSRAPGSAAPLGAYSSISAGTLAKADGDTIAALWDQSGSQINALQNTGANKPALRFVNGFPVWRFDGTNSRILLGSVSSSTPCTTILGVLSDGSQAGRLITFNSPFARLQENVGGLIGMQGAGSFFSTLSGAADDFHAVEGVFDGATSSIYLDGFFGATGNAGTTTIASDSWIGWGGSDAPTEKFKGDIFAIFVIQGRLSASDRTRVVNYLASLNPLTEQRRWNRLGAFLSASASWEEGAMQEPRPIYRGTNNWAMAYSGGWTNERIGWATSTDGLHWTKNATPIIGGGFGNEAGGVRGPCLVEPTPGTLELYYGIGFPSDLYRQVSTDNGVTWSGKVDVLPIASMPSGTNTYGNLFMAYDSTASTWRILIELGLTAGGWKLYQTTSADRTTWGTLTPVSGISIEGAETNCGGWVKEGSVYHLYYHCVSGGGQVLPTDVYHAVSSDFVNWTRVLGPAFPRYLEPIDSSLASLGTHDQFDQTSDCRLIFLNGTWYAYYDRVNNTGGKADLALATWAGPLSGLQAR